MNIAFIGVGLMGQPMVQRLLDAGHTLSLWNRTRAKAERFATQAKIADTPEQAVKDAEFIITMLESGPIVSEVLYDSLVYRHISADATVIDMSSIPPAIAKSHANLLAERGVHYLDAPVSGGTVGAEQGTLSIMVGGEKTVFERAQSIFSAFGEATYIGPHGAGQITKLANQAIVGITIGAVSEALLLAARGGADPKAVREALSGGFASSRILELHGQRMIDRHFEPGATSRVQLKDMRTILDEARAEGLHLPLSQCTYQSYLSHIANGREGLDHSSLLLELEHLNQTRLDGGEPENA